MAPRRTATKADPEARDKAREEKLAGLHSTLTEQVTALRDRRGLAALADHRQPSSTPTRFNNQLLIAAQRPDATAVAGYNAWKALGRQVNKGEKGIAILAPVLRRAGKDDGTGPPDQRGRRVEGARLSDTAPPAEERPAHPPDIVGGSAPPTSGTSRQTSGDRCPSRPRPQLLAGRPPPGCGTHSPSR